MYCLKQEFKSKREALEILKAIRERGKTNSKKPNRIYECKSCGHYHITSRRVVRK